MSKKHGILGVFAVFGILAAGCGGGGQRPSRIEITSDRSLILTRAGATETARAVVLDADGVVVENATVRWSSNRPDAIAIDDFGNVVARTDLGSAVLTAEYEGLTNIVSAVVLVLQPQTVLVPTQQVRFVSEDRTNIRLERTPVLEAILEGDVVLNGNEDGFLSRVVMAETVGDEVHLVVSDASIPEAVLEMDLVAESPIVHLQDSVDIPEGGDEPKSVGSHTAALTVAPQCELETMLVNVAFNGLRFNPQLRLQHQVVYRVRNGSLSRLELAVQGDVGFDGGLNAFSVSGGVKGKITCDIELREIPFLPVPILGPVALSAVATPALGVELEAQYAAARLTVDGLSVSKGERVRAGFGYDETQGYFLIGENQTMADDVQMARAKAAQQDSFLAKLEPFAGVRFGVGVTVGPVVVARADIVEAKVLGGYELTLDTPLDYQDPAYTGPRWKVYVGADASIDPLLDNINVLGRALSRIGLSGLETLRGYDVKLFEVIEPLVESPQVTIETRPDRIGVGEDATIVMEAPGGEVGGRVQAFSFGSQGNAMGIAGGTLDAGHRAELVWTPTLANEGTHQISGLLFDDLFGEVGLPYASTSKPFLTVECHGPNCMDNPPGPNPIPTTNPCVEYVEGGGHRVLEGVTGSYQTTFQSDSTSSHTSGSTGTSTESRTTNATTTWTCDSEGRNCRWRVTGTATVMREVTVDGEAIEVVDNTFDLERSVPFVGVGDLCNPIAVGWTHSASGTSATDSDSRQFESLGWSGTQTTTQTRSISGCYPVRVEGPRGGSVAPASWITCCANRAGNGVEMCAIPPDAP